MLEVLVALHATLIFSGSSPETKDRSDLLTSCFLAKIQFVRRLNGRKKQVSDYYVIMLVLFKAKIYNVQGPISGQYLIERYS